MPVLVAKIKPAPTVKVLDPIFKARVLLLLELKEPDVVTLKLLVVRVPCVRPSELPLKASASVTVIPEPLIVVLASVLPAHVSVPLARKSGLTDV